MEPKDFAEAYGDCNVFGATIMSIHSEYEDKFAQSIIGHANAWLGAINMPDGNGEVYPTGDRRQNLFSLQVKDGNGLTKQRSNTRTGLKARLLWALMSTASSFGQTDFGMTFHAQ